MSQELEQWRAQIDAIDGQIMTLIAERCKVVHEIGRYKKTRGLPLRDPERWAKVLKNKCERAQALSVCPEFVEKLYELIHEYSLTVEERSDQSSEAP